KIALLLAVMLAFAGGAFAIRQNLRQPPATVGAAAPAAPAVATAAKDRATTAELTRAPQAADDKPAAAKPAPAKPDTVKSAPAMTSPPSDSDAAAKPAAPAAAKLADTPQAAPAATPASSEKPAGQKPAAVSPAAAPEPQPVVQAPTPKPAPEQKPVVQTPAPASEPQPVVQAPAPERKPVVQTPAPAPKPVVQGPASVPEQKPVVAAPQPAPAAAAKPTVVETPLPEERPKISQAREERIEPAKYLFAAKELPSAGPPRAIGYYPKGCLAGGVELPVNGPHWQVMRLSRNRNWGHPELVRFLEHFAPLASKVTHWPGILIGDMAQPRGGPLPFGHRSHQVGLDVDIWFRPMPDHRLSRKQRESMEATSLVAPDWKHLNPKTWTPADAAFIKAAAEQPDVQRIFVNAVIKKELCRLDGNHNPAWLAKVRPWYGHNDHMHVRLKCPANSPLCRHQPSVPEGDGCSNKAFAFWFSDRVLHPKPAKHPKPGKQIMLADMPAACTAVLNAPAKKSHLASEEP
ncbi:MAG TPA: penicillin-insensitive murein endopeptidase, partial [Pseudolabrys sp.]|nr:penicillin-insensitive murein endopeptidase [Pseudolabrys sp.]